MLFSDRFDAGHRLATELMRLRDEEPLVLGIPRGGVPVAFVVAEALGAPLDVIVVRKLGVPYQPELAMGAVGEGGVRVLNEDVVGRGFVSSDQLAAVEARERAEVVARAGRFRGDREPVPLSGRTVVLVDDGIATGSTMRAACRIARAQGARRVVVAVPVAASDSVQRLAADADEVVCLHTPSRFFAVGEWYDEFAQTSDDDVIALLARAGSVPAPGAGVVPDPLVRDDEVTVATTAARLAGHLTVPGRASGLVIFAHGSGSSRHSPRNRYVAGLLNRAGLATLLFDLLTDEEELRRANVFDIDLLTARLIEVTAWATGQPELADLPIGYFGASTGAAAALAAAAGPPFRVAAVVSRGGRPDLAGDRLPAVEAPTLLIVGGADDVVLDLNERARTHLRCPNRLAVVPGATHLFEEPGTLQAAAELARDWFLAHLTARGDQPEPSSKEVQA
ncbi:MAG: phosphoribosyltransferase family protein [Nocardioidaceae bacterium]